MLLRRLSFCIYFFAFLAACHTRSGKEDERYAEEKARAPFEGRTSVGTIDDPRLNEISGIAASHKYPGYYWVHNDSGGAASLYLIDSVARLVGELQLPGIVNRDWEDIASTTDSLGRSILYVAEIGDNRAVYSNYSIYVVAEPEFGDVGAVPVVRADTVKSLQFRYPDGPRDAETLLVDPVTLDIFIISKREEHIHVYHWPFAAQGDGLYTLSKVGTIPFTGFVAGDIAANGQELLLKDYESVFYWRKDSGKSWRESIHPRPHRLPYPPEPQGEAIAFTLRGDGYVTISEQEGSNPPHLYFYKRKAAR